MSLRRLRQKLRDLRTIISEIEAEPRREIDIAADHDGSPDMIAQVLRIDGDQSKGRWRQLQTIYCSPQRCPRCPHGEYWYLYKRNKRGKALTVEFDGQPAFKHELLEEWAKNAKPGTAYDVRIERSNS